MLSTNIIKVNVNFTSKRYIRKKVIMKAWPNDWVPFHWSRPEKKPGYLDTGDLKTYETPSSEKLIPEARNSTELNKLDPSDPLRKLYSLEHAPVKVYRRSLDQDMFVKLGLIHELDYANSKEAKIVKLTHVLRQLQQQIEKEGSTNYNGQIRGVANLAAKRRYKHLCELKELHIDRYNKIIDMLKIEPEINLINVPYQKPFRKKQMRKLAIEYSRDLKEKKVEDFVKSLEVEKAEFEKEKEETLRWIEEAEKRIKER